MAEDETMDCQREPASFGLIVRRTEDTISAVLLLYRCLVLSLTCSHSSQGRTIGVMPSESKYSFNFSRGTTDIRAWVSSLVLEAMLSVSGLRKVSSSIASLDNSVPRSPGETSLSEE